MWTDRYSVEYLRASTLFRSLRFSFCAALFTQVYHPIDASCPGFPRHPAPSPQGNLWVLSHWPSLHYRTQFISHLSELTGLCSLVSNVLRAIVSYILSGSLLVWGGRVNLVPMTPSLPCSTSFTFLTLSFWWSIFCSNFPRKDLWEISFWDLSSQVSTYIWLIFWMSIMFYIWKIFSLRIFKTLLSCVFIFWFSGWFFFPKNF